MSTCGDGVLVVNAGSGSLRVDVVAGGDVVRTEEVDADPGGEEARSALADLLADVGGVPVVGHRVVHGGPHRTAPTVVDDDLVAELRGVVPLAPLHLPPALDALDTCRRALPDAVHVACFDTAFHADLPEAARTYAVPAAWRSWGLRRYGFHGVSYSGALRRASELLDRPVSDLHVVLAHLGGGSSVCAVREGRSVWTSMGMTPLDGVPMVKRSGSVDPGALLWLMAEKGLTAAQLADGLQQGSGLLGLSGGRSGDTRELVRWAADGDADARLALDVFCLAVRQAVAAATACLDRLDAVVLTGEIGSDQPEVRQDVCAGLGVLGLPAELDPSQDTDHVLAEGPPAVVLVRTCEAVEVARQVGQLIGR